MRFSICAWTFGNTPIEKVFELVSSAGYTAIDLTAAVDACDWAQATRLAERFSLEISGLTCDSGWPAEDHDLANKDASTDKKQLSILNARSNA